MVRRHASFDSDQAPRHIGEPGRDPAADNLPPRLRPCSHPLFAVAIVTVVLKVRTAQDYIGGVALIALSLFALWASSDLQGMHGFSFGAGTAPRMFGVLMLALGAGIATGCALTALNDVCIDKSALRHSSCHQEACVVSAEAVPYKAGRT